MNTAPLTSNHANVNVRLALEFTRRAEEARTQGDAAAWSANLRLAAEYATDAWYQSLPSEGN